VTPNFESDSSRWVENTKVIDFSSNYLKLPSASKASSLICHTLWNSVGICRAKPKKISATSDHSPF
jgi:hypothetical protein